MPVIASVLYHHIGEATVFEDGLGVTTRPDVFAAQIDWLSKHYTFINLDTLLSGVAPRNALLLTFDDAFRSVLDVARAVLAPRGIPGVFFVNPGMLEVGAISLDSVWCWAVNTFGIARACAAGGVPERDNLGAVLLSDMADLGSREREAVRQRLLAAFGAPDLSGRAPLLAPGDLAELSELGVEIGNHTATHVHCRSLQPTEVVDEIVTAQSRLSELSGRPVRSFSVPYGHKADLTPEVLEALRQSGHEAIFLVHARSNRWRPAPDIWYRVNMANHSTDRLNTILNVAPVLRSLKAVFSS